MAWTTPKTWTSGSTLTAAELNEQVRDNENYLYGQVITTPPFHVVQAFRNTALSIPNAARTLVTLTAENVDTDGFHDNATNPSRFTIPSALVPTGYTAICMMAGYVNWASNATGYRELRILRNGVTNPESSIPAISGATMGQHIALMSPGILNDYFEIDAYQNSGGSLDINSASFGLFIVGIQPT